MLSTKKVLVFAVCVGLGLPAFARFDDRHSLMPGPNPFITEPEAKPETGGGAQSAQGVQGDSLLIDRRTLGAIPKADESAMAAPVPEAKEGVVLRPLPPGKRYFPDTSKPAAAP